MEETTRKLLDDHSTFILPVEIDHDVYVLLLETVLYLNGKSLTIYCRGDGGSSRAAKAMVDLITAHGDVTGKLPGEANSSHGIVWAACQHRYVYPYARLGVHQVAFDSLSTRVDTTALSSIAADYAATDRANAEILAAASNQTAAWWNAVIKEAGSGGIKHFHATELIEMGMAKPVSEYRLPDPPELKVESLSEFKPRDRFKDKMYDI